MKIPMKLQFFSEKHEEQPANDDNQQVNEQDDKEHEPKQETKTFTRDDVAKMIAAETRKAKEEWNKELQVKQAEAEKLAKMNAEEKAEHERKQLEAKIAEYERKETINSMTKEARSMLKEKGVEANDDVISYFVSDDAENTKNSVDVLISYVEELKKKWEVERNTGVTPKQVPKNEMKYDFSRMSYEELIKLKNTNPEAYKEARTKM